MIDPATFARMCADVIRHAGDDPAEQAVCAMTVMMITLRSIGYGAGIDIIERAAQGKPRR